MEFPDATGAFEIRSQTVRYKAANQSAVRNLLRLENVLRFVGRGQPLAGDSKRMIWSESEGANG